MCIRDSKQKGNSRSAAGSSISNGAKYSSANNGSNSQRSKINQIQILLQPVRIMTHVIGMAKNIIYRFFPE
jgi:hypothetical protein